MKAKLLVLAFALSFLGCDSMKQSSNKSDSKGSGTLGSDNTKSPKPDLKAAVKTVFDQDENTKDIGITADIRKRLIDARLSSNATNVKIITQDGNVTLQGPIQSLDEKTKVDGIARSVAGSDKVTSLLVVESTP